MEIQRRGAARDDGVTTIVLKHEKLKWNTQTECLTVSSDEPVKNFTGDARHRYRLRISLDELAKFIEFIGENCNQIDQDRFEEIFIPLLRPIKRLEARAIGVL